MRTRVDTSAPALPRPAPTARRGEPMVRVFADRVRVALRMRDGRIKSVLRPPT
jgi:hypothetical protein